MRHRQEGTYKAGTAHSAHRRRRRKKSSYRINLFVLYDTIQASLSQSAKWGQHHSVCIVATVGERARARAREREAHPGKRIIRLLF